MKCTVPEISWHNREPVLSIDIQPKSKEEPFYRIASGGVDTHVVIWHLKIEDKQTVAVNCVADLQRHQKSVNAVRFSPSGKILASADDDAVILLWKQKSVEDPPDLECPDAGADQEHWTTLRMLRGHLDDVYDLSWSADSTRLLSGSVDNTAIVWNVTQGVKLGLLMEQTGFVLGVAWDPRDQYLATLNTDRTCCVYQLKNRKLKMRIAKAVLPFVDSAAEKEKPIRIFAGDTLKSFFRRLTFSPDGLLLLTPSAVVEGSNGKLCNGTFVFVRNQLNKPAAFLPTGDQYTVAVRCCPCLFTLREGTSAFTLPYRVVFAVATQNSVILYDTQQAEPFGYISNIHYTKLTDLTWSDDGRLLAVSSTDGFCSIVTFGDGELGTPYTPDSKATTVN